MPVVSIPHTVRRTQLKGVAGVSHHSKTPTTRCNQELAYHSVRIFPFSSYPPKLIVTAHWLYRWIFSAPRAGEHRRGVNRWLCFSSHRIGTRLPITLFFFSQPPCFISTYPSWDFNLHWEKYFVPSFISDRKFQSKCNQGTRKSSPLH